MPHAERLGFIRKCRSLDMALEEIRSLLRLKDAPRETAARSTSFSTITSAASLRVFESSRRWEGAPLDRPLLALIADGAYSVSALAG